MKRSSRFISVALTGAMLLGLAIPAAGFAVSPFGADKSKDAEDKLLAQGPPPWVLEKFVEMEKGEVALNGTVIKFDSKPLNKDGRILIPVRAVTEGLGGTVLYDSKTNTVTIGSPDGNTEIVFYLESGIVKIDGKEVQIDVKPGIHNSRTYVPLRFIAEAFGLKVGYDDNSGKIDMKDGPRLSPSKVEIKTEAEVKDIAVTLTLNAYAFTGIEGLSEGTGSNDEFVFNEEDAVVTLDAGYLKTLAAEKTVLTFLFEGEDENVIERPFKIELKYLEDDEDEDGEPVVTPKRLVFENEADVADTKVTLTLNGYTFEGITGLTEDEEYTLDGNILTFEADYIAGLEKEETELKLLFKKGAVEVSEELEIKLSFLEDEEESVESKIAPHKIKLDSPADAADTQVTMTLNGFTFTGIDGLDSGDDYTVSDNVVTLKEAYLEGITEEEITLKFQFKKGSEDAVEELEIEFDDME